MSGFDQNWLTLREPADRAARDAGLLRDLSDYFEDVSEKGGTNHILDLGCGTGSTWRALADHTPERTRWQLLDNDPVLLAEAEKKHGTRSEIRFVLKDLNALCDKDLNDVSCVSASAFFDLCSEEFCKRLVRTLADQQCCLYAALNYNGRMSWSIPHELDDIIVRDFNCHQQTDKGFGPALGPNASAFLSEHLQAEGYAVTLGDSPWRLGPKQAELQAALLDGFCKPVLEVGNLSAKEVGSWLGYRLWAISEPESSCLIGHTDLLALRG